MFEDGIALGVVDCTTGQLNVNPPPEHILGANEQVLLLRPTQHNHVSLQCWEHLHRVYWAVLWLNYGWAFAWSSRQCIVAVDLACLVFYLRVGYDSFQRNQEVVMQPLKICVQVRIVCGRVTLKFFRCHGCSCGAACLV